MSRERLNPTVWENSLVGASHCAFGCIHERECNGAATGTDCANDQLARLVDDTKAAPEQASARTMGDDGPGRTRPRVASALCATRGRWHTGTTKRLQADN